MNGMLAKRLVTGLTVAALAVSPVTASAQDGTLTGDRGSDMLLDTVFVRPIGLAAAIFGVATFIVSLPFTIPSGSVKEAAENMVAPPAKYTFTRPLGDFSETPR